MPDAKKPIQWWRRPSAQIEIGVDAITIRLVDGLILRSARPLHRHVLPVGILDDQQALLEQLRRAIDDSGLRRVPVDIILPDQLVRMWMVTPPGNATALADCQAAAQLRFAALFGAAPSDYEISADWNAFHPFLAAALSTDLLRRLQALCAASHLTLNSATPHFVATWNLHRTKLRREAWLVTLRDGVLTIGATAQGRLLALRSAPVNAGQVQQRSWLEQHLRREALLLNLTAPDVLQIDGTLPAQWQKNEAGQLQCLALDSVLS